MSISYSQYEVKRLTNKKCEYCGADYASLHHIVPRSMGGEDKYENIISLCHTCHLKAHNNDFSMHHGINTEMQEEFKHVVEKRMISCIQQLAEMVTTNIQSAEISRNNNHWKKNKMYFRGQIDAYKHVLDMLDLFSLGIPKEEGDIHEKKRISTQ